MVYTNTPSVADIRAAFETKPSEYPVSAHPTRAEILALRKITKSNLRKLPCLIPGTDRLGWSWTIMTEDEWDDHHIDMINSQPATDPPTAPPPYPTITNPGLFVIEAGWSDKMLHQHNIECEQQRNLFEYKAAINHACLLDLRKAIPSELIADLHDDDDDLRASVAPSTLLKHMETTWNSLKPKDIASVMQTLNLPFDETTSMALYFKRQQKCQSLLRNTPEPISEPTLIRIGLGHFERRDYLQKACREWNDTHVQPLLVPWKTFKYHFITKYGQYRDEQLTLKEAGLAHSTVTNTDLHELQTELQDAQDRSTMQMQDKDNQIAALMAHTNALNQQLQELLTATTKTCPPAAKIPDLVPASDTSSSPSTISDLTALIAKEVAAATAKNKSNNTRRRRPKTTKQFPNTNYCWTHGCDTSQNHTSGTCKNKAAGHQINATINNRMGGSEKYLDLVVQVQSNS